MAQYHSFVELLNTPYTGVVVPQKVYMPPSGQRDFDAQRKISFSVDGVLGVRLQHALVLDRQIQGLRGGSAPPNIHVNSARFTIRILWPGYTPWTDTGAIHLFDHTYQANPRTLEHIVYQLARSIQAFYNDNIGRTSTDPDWQLTRYPFDCLYLVQLRQVAIGSWQPVICVDLN